MVFSRNSNPQTFPYQGHPAQNSVWTGKCYQKENGKRNVEEIRQEFEKHSLEGEEFLTVLTKMIGHEEVLLEGNLASMVEAVAKVRQRQ